jgi:hypothetical protein
MSDVSKAWGNPDADDEAVFGALRPIEVRGGDRLSDFVPDEDALPEGNGELPDETPA